MTSKSYSEIRDELKTGDIVLFEGKGIFSRVIKWATRSRWSHVGIVVIMRESVGDDVMIWESTTLSSVPDYFTRKPTRGVQLVPFSDRLESYGGVIAVRRLAKPLTRAEQKRAFEVRQRLRGRPYERNLIQLARSALDWRFSHNKRDLSSVFCSEAVAEYMFAAGRLDRSANKPSNEWTPADFDAVAGWRDAVLITR